MKKDIQLFLFFIFITVVSLLGFYFLQKPINIVVKVNENNENPQFLPATTTTLDFYDYESDLMFRNFIKAYEPTLKDPIKLSRYENQMTRYLHLLWWWEGSKWEPEKENFYELKVNGTSCYRIWNAMGSAILDEIHPVQDMWSNEYWSTERLICEKESTFAHANSLYGIPFYYQDKWWIYEKRRGDNLDLSEMWDNCKYPCGLTTTAAFGTRVQIDLDDEIYSVTLPKHFGRYSFWEFLENETYTDEEKFFTSSTELIGKESGSYFYKDAWFDTPEYIYDDLIQSYCLKDGFTQDECDNTATYEWENKNEFINLQFKENAISCADEMNQLINKYNEGHIKLVEEYYGIPTRAYIGSQDLKWYVPKITNDSPSEYFSFIKYEYDDEGGTMRVPSVTSYTFNLQTCERVTYSEVFDIDFDTLKQKIFKYVKVSEDDSTEAMFRKVRLFIGSHRFDEEYLQKNIIFNNDALYVTFFNCGGYCWEHIYLNSREDISEEAIENYISEYGRCPEPEWWDVPCLTWSTNKFYGFIAIPLIEFEKTQ